MGSTKASSNIDASFVARFMSLIDSLPHNAKRAVELCSKAITWSDVARMVALAFATPIRIREVINGKERTYQTEWSLWYSREHRKIYIAFEVDADTLTNLNLYYKRKNNVYWDPMKGLLYGFTSGDYTFEIYLEVSDLTIIDFVIKLLQVFPTMFVFNMNEEYVYFIPGSILNVITKELDEHTAIEIMERLPLPLMYFSMLWSCVHRTVDEDTWKEIEEKIFKSVGEEFKKFVKELEKKYGKR